MTFDHILMSQAQTGAGHRPSLYSSKVRVMYFSPCHELLAWKLPVS